MPIEEKGLIKYAKFETENNSLDGDEKKYCIFRVFDSSSGFKSKHDLIQCAYEPDLS